MSARDATFTPSSTAPARRDCRSLGTSGPLNATKDERRKEDADGRHNRAGRPREDVADEGRGREDRPGGDLPNRHGIEQLRLREPAETFDQLQMNLPTPWIGLWERINIGVFLLWVVTLAAALWRTGTAKGETAANLGATSWIASSR